MQAVSVAHTWRRTYVECVKQRNPRHRAECERMARRGDLARAPRDEALAMSDGRTKWCVWHPEDDRYKSIAFCRDGTRYAS
ncbi:MAG: hypothetical protein ACRDSK_13755 [Actinophytocola sp.]